MQKGQWVFVKLAESTFRGRVKESNKDFVRVVGRGTYDGTIFDEWFAISSPKCSVVAAPGE